MEMTTKVKELADILRNQNSSTEEVENSISRYYDEIEKTTDDEEVGKSMKHLSELFSFDNIENGSIASLVCGSLIENGYPAKYITDDYIKFFNSGIKNSLPFIEVCETEIRKKNDEDYDDEIIEKTKGTFKSKFAKAIHCLEALDSYYPCGISIFSSEKSEFEKGKNSLSGISKYIKYNEAIHWMSKLFEVLFDEPIIAIDLNTKKGIRGKISGIVDNFQLQVLLMGLPELNNKVSIHNRLLDVVKGLDVQQLDKSVSGKWNMLNWECLKNKENNTSNYNDSNYWIWSEGIPDDISKFKEYRVVLLDKPSYSRGISIQRTFKNLKAGIKVEETLDKDQVEKLLNDFQRN
ncbi:MAG: hypothetical protein ACI9XB_003345 [Gammaproteobacteria bacterium]|jgi:hypothetical protein